MGPHHLLITARDGDACGGNGGGWPAGYAPPPRTSEASDGAAV